MKREYDDYLRDMLDNAEKALSFVKMKEPCMQSSAPLKLLVKRPVRFMKMYAKLILKFHGGKLLECETS